LGKDNFYIENIKSVAVKKEQNINANNRTKLTIPVKAKIKRGKLAKQANYKKEERTTLNWKETTDRFRCWIYCKEESKNKGKICSKTTTPQ